MGMQLIQGRRLCLLLFLTNMEVSIVSTSLIGIVADLGDFSKRTWLITAYLITYIGAMGFALTEHPNC